MRMLIKMNIARIIRYTSSFAGAGIFPVVEERAINWLSGQGAKCKDDERSFDRPPLVNHPITKEASASKKVRATTPNPTSGGESTLPPSPPCASILLSKMVLGAYLHGQERTVRPTVPRGS